MWEIRARATRLGRIIYGRGIREIVVYPDELLLVHYVGDIRLPRSAVANIVPSRWLLFWDSLRIDRPGGEALCVRWLARGAASMLAAAWTACGFAPRAAGATSEFRRLINRDAYFNRTALTNWQRRYADLQRQIQEACGELRLPDGVRRLLAVCVYFLAHSERLVQRRNDRFVAKKKREHASWFAKAAGQYGLTDEQQEAILRDEDNCLVVAGAGTGKTSTVAGKVSYLLRTTAARPEQILLLSFTRKAVKEMAERIARIAGESAAKHVQTATFHKLGDQIIAESEGVRLSVSKLAEDQRLMSAAVLRYLQSLFEDSDSQRDVIDFFAYHHFPYRSRFDFESAREYETYVADHERRTFKGELLKSWEEVDIANCLYLRGIEYVYERPYRHNTATVRYRQYRPDFYLPEFDLYIEHFGINKDGTTAPDIDRAEYHRGMEWKRETHRQFGTKLIETYSYERREGVLIERLETKLRAAGVVFQPRSWKVVLAALEKQRVIDPIVKLLATFLNLYKGNLWTLEELEASASPPVQEGRPGKEPARLLAFLRVFRRVLELYEGELAAAGEIDFNDMIARATKQVETGRFTSSFTHIIVDEFQDLSRGRGRLLTALLAQVADRRLFCVGDDWQSVYRFTGSDIEQMTHFGEVFGYTRRCDLTYTHRFNAELLLASSLFIQRNPKQLRKSLRAARALGERPIEIHAFTAAESRQQLLEGVLARIEQLARREWRAPMNDRNACPRVLVIGRYNFSRPPDWPTVVRRHAGRLELDFLTVHKSKGLEADYSVILDVNNGRMGFPSEIVDDPILDLVLAGTGDFPNTEERRVFYVALTRAKTRCFVLTDDSGPSKFVMELEGEDYREWVMPRDESKHLRRRSPQ